MCPNRRQLAAVILVLVTVFAARWTAADSALDAGVIKAGLKTAAPEEDGFVDRVVGLANRGTIPPKLVDSTFQWAREKPRHKFQYFKRGLILRARKIGVEL